MATMLDFESGPNKQLIVRHSSKVTPVRSWKEVRQLILELC